MTVAALVVGAGRGERFRAGGDCGRAGAAADRPKALVPLAGRPLLEWSVSALAESSEVDLVIAVVAPDVVTRLAEWAPGLAAVKKLRNG